MQIKVFTISCSEMNEANEELNRFLRANKVVNIEKQFYILNNDAYWSFCVSYLPSQASSSQEKKDNKVDYKSILDERSFANFTQLRSLRKMLSEQDVVPAYAVFIRYMDDMLLFDNDIDVLKESVRAVNKYSEEELKLRLKTPVIKQTEDTIPFLGYKIGKNVILLNSRSRNRFCRKIFKYERLLSDGIWSEKEYQSHILPLLVFVQYAYTKKMRRRVLSRIKIEEGL